ADVNFKGKKSYIDKGRYDALQTGGSITASNISYSSPDYPDLVKLESAKLLFSPTKASLENLNGSYLQTNFNANGSFDNIIGYAMKDEPLSGKLNVNADKMDLNKFMGSSTTTTADSSAGSSEPFVVPANLDLTLNASVGALHYDKVDYQDLRGSLQVKDQTVYLNNVQMKALDGSIALGGSYSTKLSRKKPDITLKYDVENLDVQKTFYAFNTVQKLMPIGKFIAGKLTSQLTMKGKLGEDMMPDMGTLTGEGTLFLIQGFLSKFQPLEKLASTLQVAELQQISLKDIKNYFEFANGKVLVKPFHVKVKDIDMEIGGMHGLDQSIDYVINMKIPREKLGSQANQLVNNLAAQASNKGIPVKVSDVIDLKVNLGGTLTQPVVKTDLKGAASSLAEDMKSQMQELVDAKKKAADSVVASAKQEVKDSLNAVKKHLAQDALQNLQKQLSGNKESSDSSADKKDSKQKLEESAKGLLNSLIKKKDKKSSDSTKKN
ncbi:MAG TPA: AsmA-like C-terminal region-containing protein, partial [Chitinophagaceae bacterium]|nr:AsmA-like C-terminal region-containing protein [Chitinophagaceae bacterium]